MTRWHINPDTYLASLCTARKRPCPFGGPDEHYPTLNEANRASEQLQVTFTAPAQRKMIVNSKESLKRNLQAFFASVRGAEIPTVMVSSHLHFNLADVRGRTLEALVSHYFTAMNMQVQKEPNGPDNFPDFIVKTREDGWVPLELKEEALDSLTPGRTNKRILRIGAAVDSLARGDELFDAVFLTASKRSTATSVIFEEVEFASFLELTGPTRSTRNSSGRVIGFDSNTKNLVRTAGQFDSKQEAVRAILSVYEQMREEEWHDRSLSLDLIRQRYEIAEDPSLLEN